MDERLSDESRLLDAAYAAADAAAAASEPRAVSAHFDPQARRIVIELRNGCVFAFPVSRFPELAVGTAEQLAAVEVDPDGDGLSWLAPNFCVSVPGLIMEAIGGHELQQHWSAEWEQRIDEHAARLRIEFATQGGKASSPAKAKAARENGKKGGRPRKSGAA
jgi:hypothetical protein